MEINTIPTPKAFLNNYFHYWFYMFFSGVDISIHISLDERPLNHKMANRVVLIKFCIRRYYEKSPHTSLTVESRGLIVGNRQKQ
jgi:hypothetical protein